MCFRSIFIKRDSQTYVDGSCVFEMSNLRIIKMPLQTSVNLPTTERMKTRGPAQRTAAPPMLRGPRGARRAPFPKKSEREASASPAADQACGSRIRVG